MKDNLRIALTFSGGGYRAATFHLGALSYLHSVKVGEFTLLDHVLLYLPYPVVLLPACDICWV